MGSAATAGVSGQPATRAENQAQRLIPQRITSITKFLPKQETAWNLSLAHTFTLYGGARGPGKSHWLRHSLLRWLILHGHGLGIRNVTAGLFCETYPELRDRQISKIRIEFPLWLGELKSTQEQGLGFHIRPEYGSGFLALRNLDKPDKYQSAEFGAIGVDELTKSTFDTFEILRGSMRWPGVHNPRFLGATNPGSIGHLWVKDLWIDKNYAAHPELAHRADEFQFVKALPRDNPYLTDAYWDELNSLSPALKRAWVDGDWDAFSGQVFSMWRRDDHTCKPFEIPSWWPRWRCVDWGFAKPWAVYWMAKDPDNDRHFVYREIYATGVTDQQQAKTIVEMTPVSEQIQVTYADPSMWAKKNVENLITTTADTYAKHGVGLTKGDNDRLSGKRKMDRILMNLPDGEPGLMIFENCVNLIRTLPALPYDQTRVEDVDTNAEDHAYDALRYGLTRLPGPPTPKQLSDRDKSLAIVRRRRARKSHQLL